MRRWPCWVLTFCSMVIVFTFFYPCESLNWVDKLVTGTISMANAEEKAKAATISEFSVRSRYMAVRLTWKARVAGKDQLTFEVHRSMVTPEGEYTLVTSVKGRPGTKTYRYIDKTVPVEENYFYKIVIPETKETFGPLQARPPFSLPTT